MNELYKILVNIQEIVKANNLFLQSFEVRISEMEKRISEIEKSVILDIQASEPIAAGAETIGE